MVDEKVNPKVTLEDVLKELNIKKPSKKIIKKLSKIDKDKYLAVFRRLKNELGYEGVRRNYTQIKRLAKISELEGDVLKTIDALVESNLYIGSGSNRSLTSDNFKAIKMLSKIDKGKYLTIFRSLKDNLGYEGVRNASDQIEKLVKISELGGDVLRAIDALAESNYYIGYHSDYSLDKNITSTDLKLIEMLSEADPGRYSAVFRRLKDKLGYGGTRDSSEQVQKLIEISQLENAIETIDALAESNFYIGFYDRSITSADLKIIKMLSKADLEKYSAVFRKLKDEFGYEGVRDFCDQIEKLIELSESEGDVLGAISSLAKKSCIDEIERSDMKKIKKLAKELQCVGFYPF